MGVSIFLNFGLGLRCFLSKKWTVIFWGSLDYSHIDRSESLLRVRAVHPTLFIFAEEPKPSATNILSRTELFSFNLTSVCYEAPGSAVRTCSN